MEWAWNSCLFNLYGCTRPVPDLHPICTRLVHNLCATCTRTWISFGYLLPDLHLLLTVQALVFLKQNIHIEDLVGVVAFSGQLQPKLIVKQGAAWVVLFFLMVISSSIKTTCYTLPDSGHNFHSAFSSYSTQKLQKPKTSRSHTESSLPIPNNLLSHTPRRNDKLPCDACTVHHVIRAFMYNKRQCKMLSTNNWAIYTSCPPEPVVAIWTQRHCVKHWIVRFWFHYHALCYGSDCTVFDIDEICLTQLFCMSRVLVKFLSV